MVYNLRVIPTLSEATRFIANQQIWVQVMLIKILQRVGSNYVLATTIFMSFLLASEAYAQERNGQDAAKALLVSSVQQWVSSQVGVSPELIEVLATDSRLIFKACDKNYVFDFAFRDRNTVSTRCESPEWRLNLRIEIKDKTAGYEFLQDFPSGKIISATDVRQVMIDNANLAVLELAEIIGRITTTSVQAGQIVREPQLEETIVRFRSTQVIDRSVIIDETMFASIEAPYKNIPMNQRIGLNDVVGAKAANDIEEGKILERDDILVPQTALFTKALIARGTLVSERFFELRTHYGDLPADAVHSKEGLGRATTIRQLAPEQVIRYSDIRPIADVNKGDIVKLTVNRGAITVTIDMLATEQGFLGDRVMLENIQSGALVDARITGPGSAERE